MSKLPHKHLGKKFMVVNIIEYNLKENLATKFREIYIDKFDLLAIF